LAEAEKAEERREKEVVGHLIEAALG